MSNPTPPATPMTPWEWVKEESEKFAKLLALSALLLYLVGVTTVNAYLTRYGVAEFSVLRPRAIVVGFWVVVLWFVLTMAVGGLLVGVVRFVEWALRKRAAKWVRWLVSTAVLVFLVWVIWLPIVRSTLRVPIHSTSAFFYLTSSVAAALVWRMKDWPFRTPWGLGLMGLSILVSVFSLSTAYGQTIYARSTDFFGGPGNRMVQLLFESKADSALKATGITLVHSAPNLSEPIRLAFETGESLILEIQSPPVADVPINSSRALHERRVIRIDRKGVRGMLFTGEMGLAPVQIANVRVTEVGATSVRAVVEVIVTDGCTEAEVREVDDRSWSLVKDTLLVVNVVGHRLAQAVCDSTAKRIDFPVSVGPVGPGKKYYLRAESWCIPAPPVAQATAQPFTCTKRKDPAGIYTKQEVVLLGSGQPAPDV